jgi:hypothetical protein
VRSSRTDLPNRISPISTATTVQHPTFNDNGAVADGRSRAYKWATVLPTGSAFPKVWLARNHVCAEWGFCGCLESWQAATNVTFKETIHYLDCFRLDSATTAESVQSHGKSVETFLNWETTCSEVKMELRCLSLLPRRQHVSRRGFTSPCKRYWYASICGLLV